MNRQEYLLVCLAEECCEVAHAASKCARFLPDDRHHSKNTTNLEDLEMELKDLFTIIHMLEEEIKCEFDISVSQAKLEKMAHFMDYSKSVGALNGK
jgi:NTP pyrophosphatase (non-canonical NTP hydrolase)